MSANMIAFGHPEVEAVTVKAGELLDLAGRVSEALGSTQRANDLSVALQALSRNCEARGYTMADVLAGLAGAMGWVLTNERDLDARTAILDVTVQTIWESARNGDAAEAGLTVAPQGRA